MIHSGGQESLELAAVSDVELADSSIHEDVTCSLVFPIQKDQHCAGDRVAPVPVGKFPWILPGCRDGGLPVYLISRISFSFVFDAWSIFCI